MIDLTFSDSTAASLKTAKAVLRQSRPYGISPLLEGSPEDVLSFPMDLDIGDLSDIDAGMDSRQALYERLFSHFPGVAAEIMKINRRALARLKEALPTPVRIRIWAGASDPSELCGLYYICHLFADSPADLSVVRVPAEFEKPPRIILYRSTGEIAVDDFEALASYDTPISPQQRELYAQLWRELKAENAPLRAVVNGRVIGVPEDFYDFALRACLPEGEFRAATLLGNALSRIPGVGDSWLYSRLRLMIDAGELTEAAPPDGDYPYSGILRKS
jgi:hypothetical protein